MTLDPDFFEVIKINDDARETTLRGRLGYIIGKAEENGQIFLSAWIYDFQEVWSVDGSDLCCLGYKDELAKADYGKHGSIRVSPTGEIL